MGKAEEYRQALRELDEWEPYLLEHSGLPGPRGNLELAAAVAEEADESSLAALGRPQPARGALRKRRGVPPRVRRRRSRAATRRRRRRGALGSPSARRRSSLADSRICRDRSTALRRRRLRRAPRRDAALGEWNGARAAGRGRRPLRTQTAREAGTRPERLGAPRPRDGRAPQLGDRRSNDFRTLRKTLGYAWSVAIVALPEEGKPLFEHCLEATIQTFAGSSERTCARSVSDAWTMSGSKSRSHERNVSRSVGDGVGRIVVLVRAAVAPTSTTCWLTEPRRRRR